MNKQKLFEEIDRVLGKVPCDEKKLLKLIETISGQEDFLVAVQKLLNYLKKSPLNWQVHFLAGNIFQNLKNFDLSIHHLTRATNLNKELFQGFNNCGVAYLAIKNKEKACEMFMKALQINPYFKDALLNLAIHYYGLGELSNAFNACKRILEFDKQDSQVLFLYGNILRDLKRYEEALQNYDMALIFDTKNPSLFSNRGNILRTIGLYEMAIDSYDQAIFLDPNFSESHCNKGSTLRFLNYLEEAIPCFDRALKIDPRSVSALVDKGMTLMTLGKLEEGLPLYEYRWENESFKALKKDRNAPLWDGKTSLQSKRILIHAEQGFGDTIQFCRYAFNIISIGGTPILEVPPTLVSLLETLSPRCQVFPTGSITPKYDFHCPIMSLPLCFKTNLSNIPCPEPYLSADPKKVKLWKEKLEYTKKQKKIGIIWSGNPDHLNDANRSIELKQFLDFLPENLTYYSLQKDVQKQDRKILSTAKNIRHFSDSLNDFSDTAAYASNLDLIITVDTGLAHLCGALGIKTWIVLPLNADWRWFRCRDDTPWYQSVSLFRQIVFGKWEDPFQNLREQLHEFL